MSNRSSLTSLSSLKSAKSFLEVSLYKKAVVVGDSKSGKTNLIEAFINGAVPDVYSPTVFENHVTDMEVEGKLLDLGIWDTSGRQDHMGIRKISYQDTDVIIICFSIGSPSSLQNVVNIWAPEIRKYLPTVPLVLVGAQNDLRHDPVTVSNLARHGEHPVTYKETLDVAEQLEANDYMECSTATDQGVARVFETVAKAAVTSNIEGKGGIKMCAVM